MKPDTAQTPIDTIDGTLWLVTDLSDADLAHLADVLYDATSAPDDNVVDDTGVDPITE